MKLSPFLDATAIAVSLLGTYVADAKPLRRANPSFVSRNGLQFELDGIPFPFAGTNVYDTAFVDSQHISDVLKEVKDNGYKVLRTWAFNELDTRNAYIPDVYFQSWKDGKPTINDGAKGLGLLDEVVSQAEEAGIKLILTLTNNWDDYGGMDVYVNQTLGDGKPHDLFYTDPQIKIYYKDYVERIVSKHKNSPAIFAWELTNEARCLSYDWNPRSPDCTPDTITEWTDEMSRHIKTLDPDHIVSNGIEGFFNRPGQGSDYEYDGSQGQDFDAILGLENIDFGTIHVYVPKDGSNADASADEAWSLQYLKEHEASGVEAQKPVVLEEYGVPRQGELDRKVTYQKWRDYIYGSKAVNGDMSWMSIQLDSCPKDNIYAICENDPDFASLVTDWTEKMNGKP
ncbi:MAG: hypothetical protein M1837_000274 [Sclerophora amabilis]|nr:MAG: hypothetical protein M1837_000274 [Sclerophora amabilis]